MSRDLVYLTHVREALHRIFDYTREGGQGFMASPMMQDAVVRNLEIVGEAVKRLSPELRSEKTTVPWSSMAGMRDVLIHGYMGVDLEIVWDVVENQLPDILTAIEDIIDEIGS